MKAQRYLEVAKEASRNSTYRHRLGAVIVKKNRILSVGFNKPEKTHPRSGNLFRTTHAELDAILRCPEESLKGSTIFVVREAASGLAMAKPCQFCLELIKAVGIKRVVYSTDDGIEEFNI